MSPSFSFSHAQVFHICPLFESFAGKTQEDEKGYSNLNFFLVAFDRK